jgi:hypothetical protein
MGLVLLVYVPKMVLTHYLAKIYLEWELGQ